MIFLIISCPQLSKHNNLVKFVFLITILFCNDLHLACKFLLHYTYYVVKNKLFFQALFDHIILSGYFSQENLCNNGGIAKRSGRMDAIL